jgi:hypothetical protein
VTGFLAGNLMPVDQNDVPATFLQMQGSADTYHARTQDEYVGLQFRHLALRKFNVACLRARLMVKLVNPAPPRKPARGAG